MTLMVVERWTLDGIEDVEIDSPEALDAWLDAIEAGKWVACRPCSGTHVHMLIFNSPMEQALNASDVPVVYQYLGATVKQRKAEGLEDFEL